jgi:hypothetical protein
MKAPAFVIVVMPRARFPFHVAQRNGDEYHILAAFEERADAQLYMQAIAHEPRKERAS